WTEYLYDGLDNILKEEQYDGEVSLYTYDKDGMLVKAENSENLLEFTRDRKTGQIIEEKQGEYTVNRTYDSEGNCTRITSSLGADIRHTYDREGNLQTMQAGESWQASWVRDNTGLEVQRTFSGGVTVRTERDCFGREVRKSVRSGGIEKGAYRYQWGIANRLLSKENELTGTVTRYDYDRFDFLIRQETMQGSETDVIYRVPDFVGNLFETPDKKDRKYGAGGKLLEDPDCFYHYDDEGNLIFREFKRLQKTGVTFDRKRMEKERGIRCLATGTGWLYEWSSNGMLKKVIRPDGRPVEFRYDALGRRTAKQYFGKVTRWVWDGNVPIHEWSYKVTDMQSDEKESTPLKEPTKDITTWVFEADTFVPTAKIQDGKQYSIVSDYLGTPIQMYDEEGNKTWDCTLNAYGKTTTFEGRSLNECPFRYQGQYEDRETGLYYNRFRYYDSSNGNYISQDPIRLRGGLNIYNYVHDSNLWIDIFGLNRRGKQTTIDHIEEVKECFLKDNPKYTHIGGGKDISGKQLPEIYIRSSNPVPKSTKGGSYADLTFESPDGQIVHINTVDRGNYNNSGMSRREYVNANRIQADAPDSIVITVRKGDTVSAGDLDIQKQNMKKGKIHNH
ncbi:RHS repeat domain-containing protein, partial [Phocaeicola sartorii]